MIQDAIAMLDEPTGGCNATKLQMPIEVAIVGEGDIIEDCLLSENAGTRCDANMVAISQVQVTNSTFQQSMCLF